jgi:hypothetical protein
MLYHWLRRSSYPPGFQVLCMTANSSSVWRIMSAGAALRKFGTLRKKPLASFKERS